MTADLRPRITASSSIREPRISLVMPCYNEEGCIGETAPALIEAFQRAGVALELVLVDNGSTDRTAEIIDGFVADGLPVKKVTVPINRGYSDGILSGLEVCSAPLVGYLCADGQVAPEDVVMTYRLLENREDRVLAKVRRRFRRDSIKRKVVSIIYNGMMQVIFGWLGAIDINGSPKIFSKRNLELMKLRSRDWFLDPEIMLKAKLMGLRVIEIDVEGQARHAGTSNVRPSTILEFLKNIGRYRIGSYLRTWRREFREQHRSAVSSARPAPVDEHAGHSMLADVRILKQKRFEDSRGFLHKVLTATQCGGDPPRGETYVTAADPGQVKGNHYHRRMGEWFAVVQGRGVLGLCDPISGERQEIALPASEARTVYVPPGVAHALANRGDELLICVAWAEAEHDPGDVFPYDVWPMRSSEPTFAEVETERDVPK